MLSKITILIDNVKEAYKETAVKAVRKMPVSGTLEQKQRHISVCVARAHGELDWICILTKIPDSTLGPRLNFTKNSVSTLGSSLEARILATVSTGVSQYTD